MYDERCSQSVNILAPVVGMVPVCAVLLVESCVDVIAELHSRRDSALGHPHGAVVPGGAVEEDSFGVCVGKVSSIAVGCVSMEGSTTHRGDGWLCSRHPER